MKETKKENPKQAKIEMYSTRSEHFQSRADKARKAEKKEEYQTKAQYNRAKADVLSSQIKLKEIKMKKNQ
jgi:hypothetical protein